MTKGQHVKSEDAQWALEETAPPLLQISLTQEPDFRRRYGLEENCFVSLGSSGVSIRRSEALNAIRKTLSGMETVELTDMNGGKWKMEAENGGGSLPRLFLFQKGEKYPVPSDFALLSPNRETRLRFLEKTASDVNLPNEARDAWRKILEKRDLDDEEVEAFHKDIFNTPARIAESIRNETVHGQFTVNNFVPSSRRYFTRLVGEYDGSISIQDYAAGGGKTFLRKTLSRNPYAGFLSSLFISPHSALTAEVQIGNLSDDELVQAYNFLEEHGDTVSQLGAIEVGLRIFRSKPRLKPALIRLIKQIRDDDPDGKTSGFKLLSALFVFVDGKLSKTKVLGPEPPFYRRLAAFSQAALIHRQFVNSGINIDSFCELLFAESAGQHYLQSLVDMRTEPCWNSVFSTAMCIKANFLDRLVATAKKYGRNIANSELYEIIFGAKSASIYSVAYELFPYPPSPLDGNEGQLRDLPARTDKAIHTQIGADTVSRSSFTALVNSAHVFRLGSEHVEAAVKALKSCGYRLSNLENGKGLTATLNGLATVAAVSRSRTLADEVRILARSYRRDDRKFLSVEGEFSVCLAAAASRTDPNEWTEFVGDWITEMAFELKESDVVGVRSALEYLCHIVPDLWVSCGEAYAAVTALSQLKT